jgi:type II secretory pathway component PulC
VVQPKPSPEPVSIGEPFKSGLTDQLGPFWNNFKAKVFTPAEGVSRSKHVAMVTLIPVLFVAVLFIFGRLLIKPSGIKGSPQAAGATTMAASIKDEVDWKVPAPYPTNLRDPMTRVPIGSAANAAVAGDLQVRGIVYSSDSPSAVVGTQIVSEGDTIFGAKVLKINKDSVEFEKGGEKWTQKVQY